MKRTVLFLFVLAMSSCLAKRSVRDSDLALSFYKGKTSDTYICSLIFGHSRDKPINHNVWARYIFIGDSVQILRSLPVQPAHIRSQRVKSETQLVYRFREERGPYVDVYLRDSVIVDIEGYFFISLP